MGGLVSFVNHTLDTESLARPKAGQRVARATHAKSARGASKDSSKSSARCDTSTWRTGEALL
ncbi:uncharacterized protein BDW70DRAFT_127213 [Aspergillus foveolatus]|uniref:uncharacterized protein n=1 Tax=Aspergillus foveolatus TaxID=210207 RepID=UPI003CCCE71D